MKKEEVYTEAQKAELDKALKKVGYWNNKGNLTVGETIYGKVDAIEEINTLVGGKNIVGKVLSLIEYNGEIVNIWLSTVLVSQVIEKNVQIGDIIAIRYLGQKKNYQNYSVAKI